MSVNACIYLAVIYVEGVTLIILCLSLSGAELFICFFQILMNASQDRFVDQTPTAIIRMDPSIAPVSVITSQLQALSTFIQREVEDVKVGMRMEERTHRQHTLAGTYIQGHTSFFISLFFFFF